MSFDRFFIALSWKNIRLGEALAINLQFVMENDVPVHAIPRTDFSRTSNSAH